MTMKYSVKILIFIFAIATIGAILLISNNTKNNIATIECKLVSFELSEEQILLSINDETLSVFVDLHDNGVHESCSLRQDTFTKIKETVLAVIYESDQFDQWEKIKLLDLQLLAILNPNEYSPEEGDSYIRLGRKKIRM